MTYYDDLAKYAKRVDPMPLRGTLRSFIAQTGKMKSLRTFMWKRHLRNAFRCSLENFGVIEFADKEDTECLAAAKRLLLRPLYCLRSLVADPMAKGGQ